MVDDRIVREPLRTGRSGARRRLTCACVSCTGAPVRTVKTKPSASCSSSDSRACAQEGARSCASSWGSRDSWFQGLRQQLLARWAAGACQAPGNGHAEEIAPAAWRPAMRRRRSRCCTALLRVRQLLPGPPRWQKWRRLRRRPAPAAAAQPEVPPAECCAAPAPPAARALLE